MPTLAFEWATCSVKLTSSKKVPLGGVRSQTQGFEVQTCKLDRVHLVDFSLGLRWTQERDS